VKILTQLWRLGFGLALFLVGRPECFVAEPAAVGPLLAYQKVSTAAGKRDWDPLQALLPSDGARRWACLLQRSWSLGRRCGSHSIRQGRHKRHHLRKVIIFQARHSGRIALSTLDLWDWVRHITVTLVTVTLVHGWWNSYVVTCRDGKFLWPLYHWLSTWSHSAAFLIQR